MSESAERLPLVLVVEDARSYRIVLRRLLVDEGTPPRPLVRMLEASNSLDALQLLVAQDPADPVRLVVADDRMPGLPGVDLLDVVGERWPGVARMLLSAYTTGEQVIGNGYRVVDKGRPDWYVKDAIMKLARGAP